MDLQQLLSVNIIEALGVESLPDDKKADLLASMIDLVQKRVLIRLVEGRSEAELAELGAALDKKDSDQLAAFAAKSGKNLEDVMKEEIAKLKGQLIERANAVT